MLCKCSIYKTLSHNGFSIYCISKPDLWLAPARHWMRNFWICGEGIVKTPEGFPSDGGLYQGHWVTGRIGHDRASCTRSSDVLACFCSTGSWRSWSLRSSLLCITLTEQKLDAEELSFGLRSGTQDWHRCLSEQQDIRAFPPRMEEEIW